MKNPTNMKELLEYAIHSKQQKSAKYKKRLLKDSGNQCRPFTDDEWRRVRTPQKASFSKGKKAAFNTIWRHYDVPITSK